MFVLTNREDVVLIVVRQVWNHLWESLMVD